MTITESGREEEKEKEGAKKTGEAKTGRREVLPTKDIAIYKALKIGEKVKIIEVIGNKVKIEVFK